VLEIKNVTKKYETKGVCVTALNNVSVTFPEKGMVFLVGKSGSGKSTLLNISGGLDSPDEGEIILKGKSLKSFTEADFDSYRNTYIGFIFQEFNVLSEYTVEENVLLALELQGKPSDKAKAEELLKKVDLEGYGKRKPNTLSGGQKQRVAIARALVKNPEIIMGDEPTGALDSATGKQVFDTLKKLSEEKLVIIVSHDRDSAEKYADRIIELKDGQIISDITKSTGGADDEKKIVSNENTLFVTPDEELSAEDMECARRFFSAPAANKRVSLKKSVSHGEFSPTDVSAVDTRVYNGGDVKFIKSRLPVKHAVRMGSSGLTIKPGKLVFTVLLSTIAFIIFGLFTTLLTFNKTDIITNEVSSGGFTAAVIETDVSIKKYSYTYRFGEAFLTEGSLSYSVLYSDEDVEKFSSDNGVKAVGIYNYNNNSSNYYTLINNVIDSSQSSLSLYYSENTSINGFCNLQNKNLSDYGLKLVAGSYPTGENEIAISVYQYELLKQGGFAPLTDFYDIVHGGQKDLLTYNDVVGESVSICKFESDLVSFNAKIVGVIDCGDIPSKYNSLKQATSDNIYWLNSRNIDGKNSTEIFALRDSFYDYYYNSFNSVYFVGDAFYEANLSHGKTRDSVKSQLVAAIKLETKWDGSDVSAEDLPEENQKLLDSYVYTTEEYNAAKNSGESGGIYFVTDYDYNSESTDGIYRHLLVQLGGSSTVKMLIGKTENAENGLSYALNYSFVEEADSAKEVVDKIMNIFLAAGIGLALFAALMLSNFISASINGKEKDIGILRAVGARGSDIFKIFITEALIVTLCCFALASAATVGVCAIVNSFVISSGVMKLSLFIFTLPDAVMIFAVAIVSAFAATILPVKRTVEKKPVEAIRCL